MSLAGHGSALVYALTRRARRDRHAGYEYSGACAAWAYRCLDLSTAKRIFVLGPSHRYYLAGCAVTTYRKYATPYGDLAVDADVLAQVKGAGAMHDIPPPKDAEEHSLEMHLPYLWKRCQETFGSPDKFPTIVPLLIGDNDGDEEKAVAKVLAPYLADADNAFVISSDFCHWGSHFGYMPYSASSDVTKLTTLRRHDAAPKTPPIHETIRLLDEAAMDAVASGKHDTFVRNLQLTGNTVCGRHPIGVAMAALEELAGDARAFRIVRYERSSLVERADDSSVSYVSAYAVV